MIEQGQGSRSVGRHASNTIMVSSLVLALAVAMLLNYVDRGTVGVAAPLLKSDLALSATEFGIAVSAFFWVYAPFQLVVGWLCDRVDVYRLFAFGMLACGLSTLLTGFAGGFVSLVALRIALGMGESVAFPGCSKIIACSVPAGRRGVANSMLAAALALGPGLGTLTGGLIMASLGWRPMFVVFGLLTLCWLLPWRALTHGLAAPEIAGPGATVSPRLLLWLKALWAVSIGHFSGNLMLYFMMAWLPLYLTQVRGFSIAEMTLLTTLSYAAQAVSALVVGWLSDRMTSRGYHEGTVRQLMVSTGFAGVAASALVVAYSTSFGMLLFGLVAAGLFQGLNGGNIFAISQIFAGPRAAGSWVGIQNTVSNLAGIVGPVATGLIIDRTGSFESAFLFTALVGFLGALWWCLAVPAVEPVSFPEDRMRL